MLADFDRDSMMEMFIYESTHNLELLEQCMIQREESDEFTADEINEIFRIMHTLKGSAAMMMYNNVSSVAHSIEDLFFYFREEHPTGVDYSKVTDLVLEGQDFIKNELAKIEAGEEADGNGEEIIKRIKTVLQQIKDTAATQTKIAEETQAAVQDAPIAQPIVQGGVQYFKATIYFEDGSEMENIRAFTVVHNIKDHAAELYHHPENLMEADDAINEIRHDGFQMYLATDLAYDTVRQHLLETVYLKTLQLDAVDSQVFQTFRDNGATNEGNKTIDMSQPVQQPPAAAVEEPPVKTAEANPPPANTNNGSMNQVMKDLPKKHTAQTMISVNISKLDTLLNLMGELVIAEAMVTQNPELEGLELESFNKAARQLHKIINDVQDIVMSIRMVPLSVTFYKMNRIVRDMCKQLEKDVQLEIVGEETEVDKNIIEHISDPLMHIIRNSVDHGIEVPEEREKKGKPLKGTVRLEAKNAGGDVLITIEDDGQGLDRRRILEKAKKNGMLKKAEEEYSDKEVYSFIMMPGFSTNENVTQYSGRGVGMDVVMTNLSEVGGGVLVDSVPGEGSVFTLKIPLTLAIIEGMLIKMGVALYTIPIASIIESFKPLKKNLFYDPDGNEMIVVRGETYNVIRMAEFYNIETDIEDIEDGILIMIENNGKTICLLVDELVGQQQVVVKMLPKYIKSVPGISGCTLLGNGDISLIVDISAFFDS